MHMCEYVFPIDASVRLSTARARALGLLVHAVEHDGLRLETEPVWSFRSAPNPGEGLAVAVALVDRPAPVSGLSERELLRRRTERDQWARSRTIGRSRMIQAAAANGRTAEAIADWFGVSTWEVVRNGYPLTEEALQAAKSA